MPTLTADLFLTVDGFARGDQSPAYFGYLGPDLQQWIDVQMAEPHVELMGRVTYEMLSGIAAADEDEGATGLREAPKIDGRLVLLEYRPVVPAS